MLFYLFLLFIALPLAEIMILVRIGQATSLWVPIAIVLVTGMAGSALARWQGLKAFDRIRDDMQAGRVPADSLLDAFLVLVTGVLFVLPGVLTDIVGIGLLIPQTRAIVKRGARAWIKRRLDVRVGPIDGGWPHASGSQIEHDQLIDVKVLGTRVEDVKR